MRKIIIILVILMIVHGLSLSANADVRVRGYYRKNGTYVSSHYRSNPDGNFWNNWSTYPNINPYTRVRGTKRTPPRSQNIIYTQRWTGGYARSTGHRGIRHRGIKCSFSLPGRIPRPPTSALGTTKFIVPINDGGQRKIIIRCFRVTSGYWKITTKLSYNNDSKLKQVVNIVEHFCKNSKQFVVTRKTTTKFNKEIK